MIVVLLSLALQAAADAPAAPEKFSILVDAKPPCRRTPGSLEDAGGIVVCAPADLEQRLPLRDERGPSEGPAPSNPELTGSAALNNGPPCGLGGCLVGFGPPIVPMVKGAVDLAGKAFAKRPDKGARVPIDLDDPAPVDVAARVLP